MKINYELKEFLAVILEAISSACLLHSGVPFDQAALISAIIGGITKDISIEKRTNSMLSSLENIVDSLSDNVDFNLTDSFIEELKTVFLSNKNIIRVMCQPDISIILKKQIIRICEQDCDCDINTFPLDNVVQMIIDEFEREVSDNHELATYATYCITRSNIQLNDIHLANDDYAKSIEDPLFLHKHIENTKVNLKNLFILPKYKIIGERYLVNTGEEIDSSFDLIDIIATALQDDTRPLLLIEGDGGTGKTTLIAWINYHYHLDDEISKRLFNYRPLLTIRLRDLDKKTISDSENLFSAILKYMNISTLDELESLFPKAVMILDGFDELCMIENNIVNYESLLTDLLHRKLEGYHFIVSSRPKFIKPSFNFPSLYISLQHFDSEQRSSWIEHYTSENYCGQKINSKVYEYITGIDDFSASNICDTPLTLYMLSAKPGSSIYLNNSWALYHHIFYEELSDTEYNIMFPNPNRKYSHDIGKYQDIIYQISEEIAFYMFKKANRNFYLSEKDLLFIIEKLSAKNSFLKEVNVQYVVGRCYALCCYWKANSDRGVVEFLHNNIRDFFLSEKIYRELDETVHILLSNNSSHSHNKIIAQKLCELFSYGVLETKVTEFIYLRAIYNMENKISDFASYEYSKKMIPSIISILSYEIINSGVLSQDNTINAIKRITNIITCSVQVYRYAYEPYLKDSETIYWLSESPNPNNILLDVFKSVFCQVPVTLSTDTMISLGSRGYYCGTNFCGYDLRNICFSFSIIKSAKFNDSILCGCDFSNTILDYSDFSNADIHYASFENASLNSCRLSGANLRGTKLPDGFVSDDQDEQIEHLRTLNIRDLIL